MSIQVFIDNKCNDKNTPTDDQFKRWTDTALQAANEILEESLSEVTITIVDKAESASLNETFRGKSGPTNVLSFVYDPIPGVPAESLGDIAICAEIVKDESQKQSVSLTAHWAHLTIHGILHLLGYDHINDDDANVMEGIEIKALATLGYDNPYDTEE